MYLEVIVINFWSQFMCLMCELLPEDRDEPERLELLDAAIPASLHASVTPVWPTCAHSRSSAVVRPSPPLPCALYRPRLCRGTISCLVWSTVQTPVCVGGSLLFGWPLSSSACRMRWRICLRLRLKIIKQNRGMHSGVCFSDARRAEGVLGSIFVSCRDHPWIPCAAARTGINSYTAASTRLLKVKVWSRGANKSKNIE